MDDVCRRICKSQFLVLKDAKNNEVTLFGKIALISYKNFGKNSSEKPILTLLIFFQRQLHVVSRVYLHIGILVCLHTTVSNLAIFP